MGTLVSYLGEAKKQIAKAGRAVAAGVEAFVLPDGQFLGIPGPDDAPGRGGNPLIAEDRSELGSDLRNLAEDIGVLKLVSGLSANDPERGAITGSRLAGEFDGGDFGF